ncbi:MAG: four helix bundle protein [Spirochaetales bacterium]|nr:four helix bundle protein [Spirochaetales bacterium]
MAFSLNNLNRVTSQMRRAAVSVQSNIVQGCSDSVNA